MMEAKGSEKWTCYNKLFYVWPEIISYVPLSLLSSHQVMSNSSRPHPCKAAHQASLFFQLSSVQFSRSVLSDSLRPHESQHARPPCPSPTPGVHSNLCPSSRWCHPTISSSVIPFSSCPQFLPASESFPVSQLFVWGGQSTRVSALASLLQRTPRTDLQNGLVGSPCSPRDSEESSPTPQFKSINSSALSLLHSPTLTAMQDHWKNDSLD